MRSPCIRHCSINKKQLCVGCGRTREEIAGWTTMTEQEQQETIKRCEERIRTENGNKEV